MKIVIPGGTGQVGTLLARAFSADGHEVVVLSRNPGKAPWRVVGWDAATLGDWAAELDGADVVINLAGRSVNCRYHAKNRRLIKESRIHSARVVGQAIARTVRAPRVWLQASTATIYAHRYDAANDEAIGILGGSERDAPATWRFSIDVAKSWEQAANEAVVPHTRKVLLRSAMTMSPDRGGVFDALLGLVRRGLGGASGDGRQYVSWIHDRDFIRAVYWLIDHPELEGPVNWAAKTYGVKAVNPGGVVAWKWGKDAKILTEPVEGYRTVTPGKPSSSTIPARAEMIFAASAAPALQQPRGARQLRHHAGNHEGPGGPAGTPRAPAVPCLRRR